MTPNPDSKTNSYLTSSINTVSNRILLGFASGTFVGLSYATIKGVPSKFRTSIMIGTNIAMCCTACYSCERTINFLRRENTKSNLPPATCWIHENNYQGTLSTYAGGGFLGGAVVATIFRASPFASVPGGFLFAALMSGACFGEDMWEQWRLEQIRIRKAENALRAGKVIFHDGGE